MNDLPLSLQEGASASLTPLDLRFVDEVDFPSFSRRALCEPLGFIYHEERTWRMPL